MQENLIKVYYANWHQHTSRIRQFLSILSLQEKERASRFSSIERRNIFITSRGLLRELLGLLLNQPPAEINIYLNMHGKPVLSNISNLHFNLAHSYYGILYAIANRAVGIDLEFHRNIDYLKISKRVCTKREFSCLNSVPTQLKLVSFFNCWTRKEAFFKAIGRGLSSELRILEICFKGNHNYSYLVHNDRIWAVGNIPLLSDYSIALAVEGSNWQWQDYYI